MMVWWNGNSLVGNCIVESHVLVLIAIGYSKGRIIIIVINRNVLSYFNGIIKKGVVLDAKDTIEEHSIECMCIGIQF